MMKALLLFVFIASANPLDFKQYTKCDKAISEMFEVLNAGNLYIANCQLKFLKSCKADQECFDRVTYKCIEMYWETKVEAIKKFNKYKCYRKSEST